MTLNDIRYFIFCVHDFVLVTVVGALGVINETLLHSCVYEGLTTYREPTVHLKPWRFSVRLCSSVLQVPLICIQLFVGWFSVLLRCP